MSAELGMIHVDLPSKEVRLTQAGVYYVSLENPQLDGDGDSTDATTPEERAFLLTHIKANLKEDWAFCTDVLKSISDGWNGSETLEAAMTEKHPNLGANTLRTNTGGALGRLGDLRLIERSWTRRKVTYLLTQAGLDEVT
ncbi:MAG TPA: hypothetical protein EYO98_06310 [Candidatus Poseidoniales archaeon]|nr:hypothetical protein [Candidatus Poseidoniales archaeon]